MLVHETVEQVTIVRWLGHDAVVIGLLVGTFFCTQLPRKGLGGTEVGIAKQVQRAEATPVTIIAAVLHVVEAVILFADQADARLRAAEGETLTGIQIADAAGAAGDLYPGALTKFRPGGNDVDHAHQRIGTVGRSVGASENLNALDIFNGQRNIGPVDRCQARSINRTAVNQDLHAPGLADVGAVVVHVGQVAGGIAHHHAGHQPHQFWHVACARATNQLPVDHRHTARHLCRALFQAGSAEYGG